MADGDMDSSNDLPAFEEDVNSQQDVLEEMTCSEINMNLIADLRVQIQLIYTDDMPIFHKPRAYAKFIEELASSHQGLKQIINRIKINNSGLIVKTLTEFRLDVTPSSIATLEREVVYAAICFDENRNVQFSTFAGQFLKYKSMHLLRDQKIHKRIEITFAAAARTTDLSRQTENSAFRDIRMNMLRDLLSLLSPLQLEVFALKFGFGGEKPLTYTEMETLIGHKRSTLQYRYTQGMALIRKTILQMDSSYAEFLNNLE